MIKRVMIFVMLLLCSMIYAEEKYEYRISITDNLNLREGPGLNYKVIKFTSEGRTEKLQLRITNSVKVLKISEKEEIINGNKGKWIYVDPGYTDKTCGWVFDYYLAKKEDFRRLSSLPDNLELEDEDGMFNYKFFKDGTVQYQHEEKVISGKLFIEKRNKVVVIKYTDSQEFFLNYDSFIYLDGKICMLGGGKVDSTKHLVGNACSKIVK